MEENNQKREESQSPSLPRRSYLLLDLKNMRVFEHMRLADAVFNYRNLQGYEES